MYVNTFTQDMLLNFPFFYIQTLQCVCRIAEVLIMLQQVGHVQYIRWQMEFDCQTVSIESEALQKQAKKMEDELKMWNKEVSLAQKEFYELNYYTTPQLLVLRRELGRIRSLGKVSQPSQHAQAMALLQSISTEITPTAVQNIVLRITTQSQIAKEDSSMQTLPISEDSHARSAEDEHSSGRVSPFSDDQELFDSDLEDMDCLQLPRNSPFTQAKLNEKQLELLTRIVNTFGYREMTALKIIENVGNEHGGDMKWDDIVSWVVNNEGSLEKEREQEDEDTHLDFETDSEGKVVKVSLRYLHCILS